MAQYTLDFSSVEEFDPLPAGEFPVVIDHVELKTGKDSGKLYLNWDLIVSDGDFSGRHLFMASGLGDKALWRLKQIFENLGVLEEEMVLEVDDDSGYVMTPELTGLPGVAVVKNEMYQNRIQNRVDDILSPYGNEVEVLPPPVQAPVSKPGGLKPQGVAPRQPVTTRPKPNLK